MTVKLHPIDFRKRPHVIHMLLRNSLKFFPSPAYWQTDWWGWPNETMRPCSGCKSPNQFTADIFQGSTISVFLAFSGNTSAVIICLFSHYCPYSIQGHRKLMLICSRPPGINRGIHGNLNKLVSQNLRYELLCLFTYVGFALRGKNSLILKP